MNYPHLAKVDDTVGMLFDKIHSRSASPRGVWQLYGRPTVGKTTTLRKLSQRLSDEGFCPLYIDAPPRALDSGAIALVRTAGALKDAQMINGKCDLISDLEYPWENKLEVITDALKRNSDKVVLLLDEPQEWAPFFYEEAHFAQRTQRVIRSLLTENNCRCVIAGKLPDRFPAEKVLLDETAEDLTPWLLNPDNWGVLSQFTARIVDTLKERVNNFSPLDMRLLVALSSVTSSFEDTLRWAVQNESRRDISKRFANELTGSPQLSELAQLWAKLALIRSPFPPSFLDDLIPSGLDEIAEGVLKNCLIFHFKEEDKMFMHELLRQDAWSHPDWLVPEERLKAHAKLSELYQASFSSKLSGYTHREALAEEMESYHHAVESGDEHLVSRLRVFFVDQLDHFGKTLSKLKRYKAAADVFHRAVILDPEDDYANHYLAYNLDIEAVSSDKVELHYQKAIELEPENVWWWSRWISYLITRGRTQAARVAWGNALDALGFPGQEGQFFVYEHLHIWVARLLIHRGVLDFATEVLGEIEKQDVGYLGFNALKATGIKALQRRLKALLEARENRAVFPLSIPPEKWWDGPHKAPLKTNEGRLVKWLPGRIEGIDEKVIYIKVAERHGDPITYYDLDLPTDLFDLYSRDENSSAIAAGRFIELSYYGSLENDPEIYVHRERLEEKDLPPLFPNPQRYILKRWPRQ